MVSFATALVECEGNLGCSIGFGNGEPKHGQHFRMAHCFQDGNTEVDQQFGQCVSGLGYRSCGVQGMAHAPGAFAVGAPNDTVRELTGRDAEDFQTIARRHAALPESRHSFRARLTSLARVMAVPILPEFNPAIYDRVQEQPVPATPHLALDDADWKTSHGIEGSVVVQSPLKEAYA